MRIAILTSLLALPVLLTSCSTPIPPQAFHTVDNTALVIDSLDANTCRMVQPTMSGKQPNDQVLTEAHRLPLHKTAIVILENYNEVPPGEDFHDRATPLFVGLRGDGYEHIYFLLGKGVSDPEGLLTLARYE